MVAVKVLFAAAALLASVTSAVAASLNPCTLPGLPVAALCYGEVQLADGFAGPAIEVRRITDQAVRDIAIEPEGNLDTAALDAFVSGTAYGEVTKRYNQTTAGRTATVDARLIFTGNTTINTTTITGVSSTAGLRKGMSLITGPSGPYPVGTLVLDFTSNTITVLNLAATSQTGGTMYAATSLPPRIKDLAIGGVRSVIYQGGSQSGQVFGHTLPAMSSFGCTAQSYTTFTVIRPSSSMYRNQRFTPGLGSGTTISLEGSATVEFTGDTVAGSPVINSVSSTAGIAAGMRLTTGPNGPFPYGVLVQTVGAGTITVSGANAITTSTAYEINATLPLARTYANGDAGPGSWGVTDDLNFAFELQDTAIEIQPIVLSVSSAVGSWVKVRQNEVVRSTAALSPLSTTATTGYIGRLGSSVGGAYSKAGDFMDAAQIVFCSALTEGQMARVRAALYDRFGIDYRRSGPRAANLVFAGDSIPSGYVTLGVYGMAQRTCDYMPDVRCLNYSVPGSQVTASVGSPYYAYTQGMYPGSIAQSAAYSKTKNVLMVLAGGNDMVNLIPGPATISAASPGVVTSVAHGMSVDSRFFCSSTGTLPSPMVTNQVYYAKTVPTADTITFAATPGGTAINTSGGSGTITCTLAPKTAASIMAGIQSVVDQAIAAGTQKVFVSTVLPRPGAIYNYILPGLNALIMAGGSGNYTPVDLYVNSCLATIPGPCYADSMGHPSVQGHQAVADIWYPAVSPYLH